MATIFLTGFPGFLGSALVERLLAQQPDDVALACLVQAKYRRLAEQTAAALEQGRGGRLQLYEGDITKPDLGLGRQLEALQQETQVVFHLAAVYDLAVSREVGRRVNVEGTRHVLRMAEGCSALRRFHYVSTCYVSGRHDGLFTEHDLAKGQRFNNDYEQTKYEAEVEVQRHMQRGLPATIYRPSIVVGDADTGATQKYDGPYYLIQWMLRWPARVPLPVPRVPQRHVINVVPRDFVADAVAHLSRLDTSEGTVYQLCDPQPPSVDAALGILARATGQRLVRVPLSPAVVKAVLRYVPGSRTDLPPDALDYFAHPTRYACTNTQRDLEGTSIACPPFASYAPRLVDFTRQHAGIAAEAMT